jgi:hypothetical protein
VTAALYIREPGIYRIPIVDARNNDDGIVVACSDVTLHVGEVFGARRNGFMTSNPVSETKPALTNIHVYGLHTHHNGGHGAQVAGKVNGVHFYRGLATDNGLTIPAHGFNAYSADQSIFAWEPEGVLSRSRINLVNKNITRVLERGVADLVRGVYPDLRSGEWDMIDGFVYVNYDVSRPLHIANEQVSGVHFVECTAMRTRNIGPGAEGHGFALDDYVRDSWVIDCKSLFNSGAAFTNNGGRNNHFIGCLERENRSGLKLLANCINTEVVGLPYTGILG